MLEAAFRELVFLLLNDTHRIVGCAADFSARLRRLGHAVGNELAKQKQRQAGLRRVPVHRRDLRSVEAHEAVAAFQRMVEESELVILHERRKPEREPAPYPFPKNSEGLTAAPFIATKHLSAERPKVGAIMSELWAT